MEKANKWIKNYLMGKKGEKYKIDRSSIGNNIGESPKVKSRWSFGRKSSGRMTGKVAMHRFSTSFDSSDYASLQIQSVVQTEASKSVSTTLAEVPKDIESAAATKIQASFRSYLARKALLALRGLVKIQALVRGHLVRKQTRATLQGMHALMAIQVRARIHRIQTAGEANLLLQKHSSQNRQISRDKSLLREFKDSKDMNLKEMLEVMESRCGSPDPSDTKHVAMSFYSKHSKQKYQYKHNALIKEPSSSKNNLSSCQRHSVSWAPNYRTRTESSKAKVRSFSEPKQRPKQGMKHKNKSIGSTKDLIIPLNDRRQSLSSNSSRFIYHGSLDHWVMNPYESLTDRKSDSFNSSMATSDSYY